MSKMDKRDKFVDQLEIDETDLGSALSGQSQVSYHVGDLYAKAVADRDEVALELETMEAELGQEIREKYEGDKVTETQIKNEIRLEPRHKELRQMLHEKTTEAARWKALVEGFTQRSYMLRELVTLHITDVWSTIRVSDDGDGKARLAEARRQESNRLREKQARRRVKRERG